MSSRRIAAVRAYWGASDDGDWDAAGRCIGPGYVWIDHATGVVARTPDALRDALVDAQAWTNTQFRIENAYEASDGTVIVQAVQSCTVTGSWRSMVARGQRISFPICTIFTFDGDDKIVHEETYYDMLSVREQLGY